MSVAEGDEVIVLHPAFCASCQQPVDGDAPQPQRHHVCDLPPMCPVVTESPWHRVSCPGGGEATHAAWPVGVPSGMGGPRAHAMASRCPGASRLSQRTTQRLLDDLCGLQGRVGMISQLEATTTAAVASPVEEARSFVQEQSSAHRDETGGRAGGQRAWLGVAATMGGTVCVVRLSRGGQVARDLVGEACGGILVTDRWSASHGYPVRWRHRCWAPRRRDSAAMMERGGGSQESGEALQRQAPQLLHGWHRVRDGPRSRSSFRSAMRPVRREVARLLEAGSTCGVPKTAGLCRDILTLRQALWPCVPLAGVEPTHNPAERAMRPGVWWRKGRCGTHSAQGSRFVASMMTVVATLKQQQRNVLEYLTTACEAALHDAPAPSLLPVSLVAPSDQGAA